MSRDSQPRLSRGRTNEFGARTAVVTRWNCVHPQSFAARAVNSIGLQGMLSKVEVRVPDSGPLRPSRSIDSRPLRPRPGARDTRCVTRDLRKLALSERGRSRSAWDRPSSSTCRAGSWIRSKSHGLSSTAAQSRSPRNGRLRPWVAILADEAKVQRRGPKGREASDGTARVLPSDVSKGDARLLRFPQAR